MTGCAVANCSNHPVRTYGAVTYHRFPLNEATRKIWIEKCKRGDDFDCSRSRVCSNHFSEDDFERDLQGELLGQPLKKRLKKGAVPNLNLIKIKEEPLDSNEYGRLNVSVSSVNLVKLKRALGYDTLDSSDLECTSTTESRFATGLNTEQIEIFPDQIVSVKIPENAVPTASARVPSSLPASQNWSGEFGFNVSFGPQEKNTKGCAWTYSEMKDKLYVGKDTPCPINFSANTILSDDVAIRAMALYNSPEHASDIVHRCINHSMEEERKGIFEAEHLIRCESSMASYQVDRTTRRHSVIVPFENPPVGQQFSTYIYKFACFGSCAGGPNRRPLMLVFTLERGGQVIGRRKLDVKICACPGRDRKAEEQQQCTEMQEEGHSSLKRKECSDFVKLSDALEFTKSVTYPPPKKAKVTPNKDGCYTITVQDLECYEFLKQMKKLYEMCKTMEALPPVVKKALLHYQRRKNE